MISVVIPTYRRHERLRNLLDALRMQTLPPNEVVVVDQTPHAERPSRFYERFSDLPLELIDLESPSLSGSRNIGAKEAKGEYLLFLDDDMIIDDSLISNHIEVMKKERVDVVYGAISTSGELPETYQRDTTRLDPLGFFLKSPNKNWCGMTLVTSGANTMIRSELFADVGGYDENMPRMEDIELGYRLYLKGAKIYYSTLPHAIHDAAPAGGTRSTQNDMMYARVISKVYLYRKHFAGWTTTQFYLLIVKNAFTYRDPISGTFYLSHLKKFYWPIYIIRLLAKAHAEAKRLITR